VAKKPKAHKPFNYLEDMKSKYYVYVRADGTTVCSVSRYKDDGEFLHCANDRKEGMPFIRCENMSDIEGNIADVREKYNTYLQHKDMREHMERLAGPEIVLMYNNKPADCKCSLERYWRHIKCICKVPPASMWDR
jgi:hypothetical protein